jgi:hypothetical protein
LTHDLGLYAASAIGHDNFALLGDALKKRRFIGRLEVAANVIEGLEFGLRWHMDWAHQDHKRFNGRR